MSHREEENTEVKANNLTEVPKAQRATERSVRVADSFGNKRFKKSCKPLLCNEVDKNINKTRKYSLFLHAPTVPLCLMISAI